MNIDSNTSMKKGYMLDLYTKFSYRGDYAKIFSQDYGQTFLPAVGLSAQTKRQD